MNTKELPIVKLVSEHFPKEATTIIVAVSGGPDSVALLYLLLKEVALRDWELIVAHLNHQLREESSKDTEFVKNIAKKLGLKCVVAKKDVEAFAIKGKMTIEEAAREVRYKFLRKTAQKYKAQTIALAHTADDQVETVVLNWLRGGLVRALSGMKEWNGELWRPFLNISKKELLDFLKAHEFDYCTDKSNESLKYSRNKVRKQVIPVLENINPGFSEVMLRNAKTFIKLEDFIEGILQNTIKKVVISKSKQTIVIKKKEFIGLAEYLQNELLLWAIAELKGNKQDIKGIHLVEIKKVIQSRQKESWKQLPDKLFVSRAYDKISFSRTKPNLKK